MDDLLSPDDVERMAAEAGMPLKELFERAGISRWTFERWRAGKTEPSLTNYRKISEVLRAARAV